MPRDASAVPAALRLISCFLLSVSCLSGCFIEPGDKACGPHQHDVERPGTHYCLCDSGYVVDDDSVGCKRCGENEDSDGVTCFCKSGYARPQDGEPCAESSVGAGCSSNAACEGERAVCVMDDAEGYCSVEGCVTSKDCQPHWVCEQTSPSSICKKPPPGYGQSCDGPDDCAGTAATFCESFQTHTCLLQGCGKGAPCPGDWSCCDISLLGVSLCIEPSGIVDGVCPAGGMLVTP